MVDQSLIWIGHALVVRYMRFKAAFPARNFVEGDAPAGRVRFLAVTRQLAEEGKLPDGTHGHFLKAPYNKIFELKPPGSRYFGFFHGSNFYITNGALKKKAKEQEADYKRAEAMRVDFLDRLAKKIQKRKDNK